MTTNLSKSTIEAGAPLNEEWVGILLVPAQMVSNVLKFFVVVLTISTLWAYQINQPALRSLDQAKFDSWFLKTRESLQSDQEKVLNGPITVSVQFLETSERPPMTLQLQPGRDSKERQQMIRILQLLRILNPFSSSERGAGSEGIRVSLHAPDLQLTGSLPSRFIQERIEFQSFLKLLQLYSEEASRSSLIARNDTLHPSEDEVKEEKNEDS